MKWNGKGDPRGAYCMMEWEGKTLLGEITGVYRDEVLGCTLFSVRHFNGDRWPLNPHIYSVDILIRRATRNRELNP